MKSMAPRIPHEIKYAPTNKRIVYIIGQNLGASFFYKAQKVSDSFVKVLYSRGLKKKLVRTFEFL